MSIGGMGEARSERYNNSDTHVFNTRHSTWSAGPLRKHTHLRYMLLGLAFKIGDMLAIAIVRPPPLNAGITYACNSAVCLALSSEWRSTKLCLNPLVSGGKLVRPNPWLYTYAESRPVALT